MEWQKDHVDIHVISGSHSTQYHLRADFVIDASGNGSLTRFFPDSQSGPAAFLPKQKAVFAHFQDVGRLDDIHPSGPIPYPTDEAALHHVFPGGWMWVLHFNNGLTSAGFSLTTSGHFKESCLMEPARAWNEMVSQFPTIQEQFRHAKPVTPIYQSQEVSFCRNICAGNRWVSLPSAYGFTDPLLSTGFALNLTGIARLALFIKSAGWDVEKMGRFLLDYQTQTMEDFKESARYVGALLESLASPEHFRNKALVYFTAAIQQETRMRLQHLLPTTGFLYRSNSPWREAAHKILGSPHFVSGWSQALEPFDLAGLTDESRGLQFPATPEDLIKNHYKIPASISEIDHMMKMSRNI
jgi:FADH2 O2-dependent halogenase